MSRDLSHELATAEAEWRHVDAAGRVDMCTQQVTDRARAKVRVIRARIELVAQKTDSARQEYAAARAEAVETGIAWLVEAIES